MKQMTLYKFLDEYSQHGRYVSALDILPYHRPYNFLAAERGGGKTTLSAGLAIGMYIFNGTRFIYTRRKKDETLLTCGSFFDSSARIASDVLNKEIKVEYKGGDYYITVDGKKDKLGTIVPLSMEYKYKSYDFSTYNLIVYDEFLTDPRKNQTYLGGNSRPNAECVSMLSLYQTVDRGIGRPFRNETIVLFLGNTATIYNPFFLTYGVADELQRNPDARMIAPKGKPWLLYSPHVSAVDEGYNGSNVQALSMPEDEAYSKGAGIDDNTFVGDIKEARRPLINIIIKGVKYGIYTTDGMERFLASPEPSQFAKTISVDILGHDGKMDMLMVKAWKGISELDVFSEAFLQGRAMFKNGKVKDAFLKYLNYLPN